MSFRDYTSSLKTSLKEALIKINANKKRFIVIVNDKNTLLGTVTDGDIRRALISGCSLESQIMDILTGNCIKLYTYNHIKDAIEYFKKESVDFLPIVNEKNELVNILTKKQLHSLLLLDKHVDWTFDFTQLDENIVDYEIFRRPWGFYKTTVMNDYFQSKVISVEPEGELSLQSHNRREEYWIIAHGHGVVQLGESVVNVSQGSNLFIPKGCKHRLKNTGNESLVLIEVQIGDYFGEDDIIRYADKYGRK